MRRLYILLIIWCLLVAVPGVLVTLGVFGYFDMKTEVHGVVVGFWIVGYLAQFGIFMWIANITNTQKIFWWFGASLLPWGFDWILPVHPLFALPLFFLLIGIAISIAVTDGRAESLKEHGVRAMGVVIEVLKPWMNVVINTVYIRRKVRLKIERRDGVATYEALYKGLFMIGNIPSPGDRLPLLVDPKNPQRLAYDEEGSEADAASERSRILSTPSSTEEPALVKELEKLTDLHKRGELTDAEFAAAKKKLLH